MTEWNIKYDPFKNYDISEEAKQELNEDPVLEAQAIVTLEMDKKYQTRICLNEGPALKI